MDSECRVKNGSSSDMETPSITHYPLPIIHPVVVLADGGFPTHFVPLDMLESAGTIVCCDGAAEKLLHYGKEPGYIVGDLDSLSSALKIRFTDRLHCFDSQETNDLTKAVEFCIRQGVQAITIVGATGLREDHTIANVSLLADYAAKCRVEMITDYGIFTAITKTTAFESYAGQQVSIFALTPEKPVTLHGLKYPLHKHKLLSWWMGSLNEANGAEFTIEFEEGTLIVFRTHEGAKGKRTKT